MSFLKSAVNQVGRDLGKVVSNSLFNDHHASPYRKVRGAEISVQNSYKTDFEKAIGFQTGYRPSTLISKISGVYTIMKNETNHFLMDDYLDTIESDILFNMMQRFNDKVDDICDILEIDEDSYEREIKQLTKIVEKANLLFKDTLRLSAKGCESRKIEHLNKASEVKQIKFVKYVGLNVLWMGKYARGGKKSITNSLLANMFDLVFFIWPITRAYLFLEGILTFSKERNRRNNLKETHLKLSDLEARRASAYLNIQL